MPPGQSDGEERVDADEVTRLLREGRSGSESARDRLIGLIYDELHVIAASLMRREDPAHTLQSTALVHEAYFRLMGPGTDWTNRRHFFGAAARAMRQVLTDYARRKRRRKRDASHLDRVTLANLPAGDTDDSLDVLALNEALEELEALDRRKAAAIELHYYAGLSYEELAETLDVSPATVHRDLRMARAWLRDRLGSKG
jgi:RNA polymerase sigma factor (TIGR02999 family)